MSTATITRKVGQYTVWCDNHDKIIAIAVHDGMRIEYRVPYIELPLFGKLSMKGEDIKYLKRAIKMKIPIDISHSLVYNNERW